MYEIQIYIVAKNIYKTLARISDKQAAIEYASTIGGTVTIRKGNEKINYEFF